MSDFFKNGSQGNDKGSQTPARLPNGPFSSLASITAAKRNTEQPATNTSSLGALADAKRKIAAHRLRPFLVYFILDLTASRSETRAAMQSYEKQIAKLVMESGGKHPVQCKGVYFRGGYCSSPRLLENPQAVENFFNERPESGGTQITEALQHYKNDPTDAVLSLAIMIGDTADSDDGNILIKLAQSLQSGKVARPVVIAHEQTDDTYSRGFCQTLAPAIAKASGGHSFGLSEQPTELIALLDGYKQILNATPEELKEAVKTGASGGNIFAKLSPRGREFLVSQASRLSVPLLSGPSGT